MYSFVRGARLFVKGARDPEDPDNIPDPGDHVQHDLNYHMPAVYQQKHHSNSQMASASQESKEVFRTAHNRSGIRTVHTSRVIRKTTTLTKGEQKTMAQNHTTTMPAIETKSTSTQHAIRMPAREYGTQTLHENHSFRSTGTDTVDSEHVKRVHRVKDTSDIRKKMKISDIITHQTDERITAKEALLRWARRTTDKYPSVKISDFTSSWRDGLAFNAIIHRNRPDLVDYRQCLKRTARDNLDSAFTVAERDLNVTKLLDPEDVDTPEPDEKSLITYISSLYDVFPRPPSHNPFSTDDEKVRKLEQYKDLSSSLIIWMRDALSMLQDRNFPNTLVEMKSLLAECTRFRVEDVPPRLHEKQRLSHVYRELQKIFRDLDISDELRYESIERYWNRVMSAHQERDLAIHDEIARLEKLQRLAEKVHRETKQCDGKLDDIERHIAEEEKRIQRLHPSDAKHNCDQIENELKHVEESLKSMARDVQTLRDGRYHQAPELHKRVQQLHERWLNIRISFQTRLLSVLATRSLKTEERKTPKPRPVSLEKLIETNKSFKFLQECIDWVHSKLKYLEDADYGTDLPSAQAFLEQHHTEHRLIDQFQKNVDQCEAQKSQFRGEELELYCKLLSRLEKGYSELLILSNKRMSDLEILLDFIKSATNELIWMNEKEETEASRDWSSSTLNILELEQYQKVFTGELERREKQFNSVQDHGEGLILQKHPAAKCIEAYLAAMQTQWSWLLQLILCLEVHLKYASVYHQFFTEAKECQQWLRRIEDRLNTTYSRQNFSIDEGERLMKEMQELRDDLSHYSSVVSTLIERSKDIVPLKQRRQTLPRPLRVTAVCSYKHHNMSVAKDEHCWLHDNSQKSKWRIINSNGTEGMVPGVCFLIPPPNPEALELAESLKKHFELIVNLWTSKQRKLRQNMIFATIKIIKSWDITKFRSIEPIQRESIIKALNEDTQKLLNEGSSNDPALKRLQEEIAYCNKLFADLQRMLDQDEIDRASKTQARKFNELVSSVQSNLTEKERTLKQRTQAAIPRSKHLVDQLMQEHKSFESDLQAVEPKVSEIREAFRELANKTPALQSRHDTVMESWNNLWSMSSLYVERLKSVDVALLHYEEATQVVSNVELKLISYDDMPSDIETAVKVEHSLMSLQREIQHQQGTVDRMTEDVANVRHLVELSRPHQVVHTDVSKLEEDSRKIRRRWDQASTQIRERLRAVETSVELLKNYEGKAEEQRAWVSQMNVKVESMKAVSQMDSQEMHREVESTMNLYTTVGQRKAVIEEVNVDGGRFLREAKIYDLQLKQYLDGLEEVQPPEDESTSKKAKVLSGAQIVSQELDALNQQYSDLTNALLQRLNELKSLVSNQEGQKFSVTIIQAAPIILKTFRTELVFERALFPSTSASCSGNSSSVDPQSLHLCQNSSTVNCMPGYDYSSLCKSYVEAFPDNTKEDLGKNGPSFTSSVSIDVDRVYEPMVVEIAQNKNLSGVSLTISDEKTSTLLSTTSYERTDSFIEMKIILHPSTGKKLTVNEAVQCKILSLSPPGFFNSVSKEFLSLEEATSRGFIDSKTLDLLVKPVGIFDPVSQTELSLLEAANKGIYNICTGKLRNPVTKRDISTVEALSLKLITKETVLYLFQSKVLRPESHSIIEAVSHGYLNSKSGVYISPVFSAELSLVGAYELGLIVVSDSPYMKCGISLAEAVNKSIVNDATGRIMNFDSGEWCTVSAAVEDEVLAGKYTEIADTLSGQFLSLKDALRAGVIDETTGRYFNTKSRQRCRFKEACEQQLIIVPLTLRDAYVQELMDDSGLITSVLSKNKLSVLEAVECGMMNVSDKCIVCPSTGSMLTILEALARGVLSPQGFIIDLKTKEKLTITEAANRGLLASVCHKSVFEIEGFKDTSSGEFVHFNTALLKGIIDPTSGKIKDLSSGKLLTFEEAVKLQFVQPQIYDMLNKEIGVRDGVNVRKTLLDCVLSDLIDPLTGNVKDPETKRSLNLLNAVEKGIITEDTAVIIKSLMNITVTLTTVTKTTTRYVTVMQGDVVSESKITFKDAFDRGLIDETAGTFKDLVSGNVIPLEEAIVKGLLGLTSSPEAISNSSEEPGVKRAVQKSAEESVGVVDFHLKENGKVTIDAEFLHLDRSDNENTTSSVNSLRVDKGVETDMENRKSILFGKIASYAKISKQERSVMADLSHLDDLGGKPQNSSKVPFESVFFLVKEASGGYVTYGEAEKSGLIDTNTGEYCDKIRRKRFSFQEAKLMGLLIPFASLEFGEITADLQGILESNQPNVVNAIVSSETPLASKPLRVRQSDASTARAKTEHGNRDNLVENETVLPAEPECVSNEHLPTAKKEVKQCKSQYTVPRFEVTIGRAHSVQSPAKAVTLQKVRRKKMKPKVAAKKGLVDEKTADVLNEIESMKGPNGKSVSLKDAVLLNIIDGNAGSIANPKSSNKLTINEAITDGILDPESGQLMLPVGRSLSIPEALTQGLVEPVQQKIVHPEHGDHLTIQEAIVCDIIDPLSEMTEPTTGENLTLEKAIDIGVIDCETSEVQLWDSKVSILEAVDLEIFKCSSTISTCFPPLALTFSVALGHGSVDIESREYVHPVTGKRTPLSSAIECGLIMTVQGEATEHSIDIWAALDRKLIDPILCTMRHPINDELLTVNEAIESGILQITVQGAVTARDMHDETSENCFQNSLLATTSIGKFYLLQDLLRYEFINKLECYITDNDGKKYPLSSAAGTEYVSSNALVKVISSVDVEVIIDSLYRGMQNSPFTFAFATKVGFYDPTNKKFANPVTKKEIEFSELFSLGILDQTLLFVKDCKTDSFHSFAEAFSMALVDKSTGESLSCNKNEKASCFECTELGMIISICEHKLMKPLKLLSFKLAVEKGIFDLEKVAVKLPGTTCFIPLCEALLHEIIEPKSVKVFDGKETLLGLPEATEVGLVDLQKNIYTHSVTKQEITLENSFKKGLITVKRKAMSLEAAVKLNLYNPTDGSFVEPLTCVKMDVEQAVKRGLIDSFLTLIKDTKTQKILSLKESLEKRIVIAKSGKLRDTVSSSLLTFDVALRKGLIQSADVQLSLIEAVEKEFYDPEYKKIFNPILGQYVTLSSAVENCFINPVSVLVTDVMSDKTVTLEVALSEGIINSECMMKALKSCDGKNVPEYVDVDLKDALELGLISAVTKPFSLEQVVQMKLLNPKTGQVADPSTNRILDLQQAVDEGMIDGESTLVICGGVLKTLSVALQDKSIDVTTGTMFDSSKQCSVSVVSALEQNLIVPFDRKTSFCSLLKQPISSAIVVPPFDTLELTVGAAIKHGCINTTVAVVKDEDSCLFKCLEDAILDNRIDVNKKISFPVSGVHVNQIAFYDNEITIFLKQPKSMRQAISDGSLNIISGVYIDIENKQRLTLREAVAIGLLDPHSAVLKDTKQKRIIRMTESFSKKQFDAEKGTVQNTSSGQVFTIKAAIESSILLLSGGPLSLFDALDYGLFSTDTNMFLDPFAGAYLTCDDAINVGLLDVTSAIVRSPSNDEFMPFSEAAERGIIDPKRGHLLDSKSGKGINLLCAYQDGFILPAAKRVAIEEKYRLYVDNTAKLLSWVHEIEMQLADLGHVREDAEDLHRQIGLAKDVKQDIDEHQRPVTSCLDQVQQLIEDGKDVLGREEIHYLQKNSDTLRKRFMRASEESDKLLRRLNAAFDELRKFSNELISFMEWMKDAHVKQGDKERCLADLDHIKEHADAFKAFSSDAIAHQADLRFITMAAQKFIDESKDYLKVLNDFRTNLPHRLAHLEPGESEVKGKVQEISSAFQSLLNRIERLGERFSILTARQRDFAEHVEKTSNWLNSVQKSAKKLIDEPIAADPRSVQDQLDRVKAVSIEIVQQGRLIDSVRNAANALLVALEDADASPAERQMIEEKIKHLEEEYNRISNAINVKNNELQMALIQSQDIQDGLDRLLKWLDDAESMFRNQNRPVSLIKEKMEEQIQEHKLLLSDIDGQKPTVDAINESAFGLLNGSNSRLAKKVENKLKEVAVRFEKICEKAQRRSDLLEEICKLLGMFQAMSGRFEEWLVTMIDTMQAKDAETLDISVIEDVVNQRDARRDSYEEIMRSGKSLVSKRDVTDTNVVKGKTKSLEQLWKDLSDLLTEKHRRNKEMAEQLSAYEALRNKVLEWLNHMEARVENLEPLAVDKEVLRRQSLEIKPLMKEHADYAPTVDRVNVLGNNYETTLRGDSSLHRRVGSPTKRGTLPSSPTRTSPPKLRRSPDFTSPQAKSPYSSISSGFGSARSSADNIGNIEDLSPVQQQLCEINHRYSLLGTRLSDRSQEINTLTDEIKICFESLKNLATFVQAKERQIPRDAVPISKDTAVKQLQSLKSILDEMQERQLEMDRLKAQTQDLVKRKPNASGVDSLQQQVSDVAARWNELRGALKQRTNILQDMKDFQDAYESLNSWLGQKEKMFQVLGPIASEPRMVMSQIQQLQVLHDEFTSQEPVVHRFRDKSHAILDHLDVGSQGAKKIREQVQTINTRWDDLLAKLADRERNLDAASGATKDFQDGLNRLQDRLQHVGDEFDHLSEAGSDAEDQLRQLNDLEEQLDEQRPLLADADVMCNQLCNILSDSASKSEIKSKLGAVEKLYNNLNRKINNRKAELESSLKEDRDFYYSFDRIQQWLNDIESTLAQSFPVSAEHDILQRQVKEFEPLYKEVLNKDHEIHMLMSKGAEMLPKITRKAEAAQLQSKMDTTKRQWDKVRKAATDRHTHLQKCSENCKKYHLVLESFLPWLNRSEEKLNGLQSISFHRAQLDKQVKEIQAFKNDISKHSQEYENVRHSADVLIMSCDVDTNSVKDVVDSIRKRWDRLNQDVFERAQALEDVSHKLALYQDKARDAHHSLNRLEDRLHSHDALGDSSRDPKLLARMKTLLTEADALQKQLDSLKDNSVSLIAEASPSVDTSHITDEVEDLEKRHKHLMQILEDRCSDLESASEVVSHFNNKMKDGHHHLNNLDEELDNMAPIGRDIDTVTRQIDEIKVYLRRLKKSREEFEDLEQNCQEIIAHGYSPDPKGSRNQLDVLHRQLIRLEERAKSRDAGLETMLGRLERFYEDYNEILRELDDTVREEYTFKPIGGEVDAIRSQQDQFKAYRRDRLEPMGKHIDSINKVGQGLIQSAAPGVNTNILEQDLDVLNDRWNNLKQKMNERERRLDSAFLQSGKFQEALEGVQKWLEDTEDLVANQKQPSADYKVVKAQLQEQKFLNKLLMDRQSNMESLMAMGQEVMKNLEPRERSEVEAQLNDLMQRFEELTNAAQDRTEALEQTIPVAKDFQDKMAPLVEWLEHVEKRLAIMATIPSDQEKIRKRMMEHDALHEDIMDHKQAFEELTEIAQMLMSLVGDDEAQMVVDKLQEVTNHYAKVVEDSEHIGQLLAEAYQGVGSFTVNYEDLMAWINEMASRLSRFHTLSVYVEKLQEQLDELVELSEEIADHQKQVDDVTTSGQEIMKHASGDDVICMKEKLDSLSMKFTDLTSRAADRLRQAQDSLPLVQNFHSSHKRVNAWMDSAERQLKALETVGLSSQETIIQRLESEVQENRPLVDTLNHLGPQLCQMSPGEGAAVIESEVTKVNRRFDAISEQVQRKAERIDLSKQRNVEVVGDIEDLLDWFHEIEKQMLHAEPLTADPDVLGVQLKEQKVLNDEVSSQKGRVRDILSAAKKLMRESSSEDLAEVRDKADELKNIANAVSSLCSDRLSALEQALPLAEHFFETHVDLCQWLDEIEAEADLQEAPALNAHQIKKQQDRNKALIQSVNEHKPLVDKLNKTGAALKKLCSPSEGNKVQKVVDSDNSRYNALKDILRDRQNALEEAMQATSQFSDKLDGMLNSLSNTADQLNNAEPISAHPEKIEEQLGENKSVLKDLDKRSNALEAVKRAADDVIVKAGNARDPAVRDIKQKLDKLNDLWDNIQKLAHNRGRSLEDALAAAERFWDELTMVMKALNELQESLNAQEPPAVEPNAIQHQQDVLQEIRQEMEQTKPEVDQCRLAGQDLMQLCGEPDKPEVKKHIEDLDSAWDNVTSLYAKREQNLIAAMEKAMNFHDILQNILEFLDYAEDNFSALGPVGSDIEAVKGQILQLKDFKNEVDPHMIDVEAINRQAHELMERTSPAQARAIKEPLSEINKRWDELLKGIVNRQTELENALLRLGQFQHALDEFLVWISKTEMTLDDLRPVFGDPQVIEVELAKHKVLMNDIQAHQTSVDTLNRAGRQLIEANRGSEDASVTQNKLNNLNKRWQHLQDKSAERQNELEEALKEAQIFNQEIQDLLMWLSDIDSQLVSSKPVGGLPETAREQLNRFMELYNDLDSNKHKVDGCLQQGQNYLKRSNEGAATNLQHNLRTLKQRWENVLNRANDRKIKLEIAFREATEFHEALQDFVEWLTNAEKFLSSLKPVSRVMDAVLEQIEDHKTFQKEVASHREVMLNLDKKGTHLKYFSQKQDVILIKNLLISVQHRWERVVSKAAERTRSLDHGYKESKEFHDAWSDLSKWLNEAEKGLDISTHVGNDPEKIKQLLAKHKEFQRTLGAKQPLFDGTMKLGRNLKEKCPKADIPVLQSMLDDLKNKWNNVCSKSVDRQRKLEEALLFSGQFKDAVQALIDWLDKAKIALSEDQLLHGDLDTVMALVDQHNTFQDELKNRANNLESVRRTAKELLESANPEDADHIRQQIQHLDTMWFEVAKLSDDKQRRLQEALREAEKLHKAVHMLLEWLSDAEMKLRFAGPLPDDEETTKQQIEDHQRFMKEMAEQEVNKDTTIGHAQEILKKCHPDGVSVIRHWITIIQSRWEEVSLWAKQREQRLSDHLRSLRDVLDLLEELLAWLIGAEVSLTALEAEPLPDEIPVLEQLIVDHQGFMNDMTKRQPDVERVTKAFQSKRQPQPPPGKDKGRERHESAQDRKSGRGTPSGKGPARQAFEPEIKNPRARELVDKWRNVWLLAMERQRRLEDKLNYLKELERIKNFDFDEWRRKFLAWMNNKKSRVMDLFRKIDKDNDGRVTREEFIDGILKSKFPTSRMEMERVAEIFDRNGDGFIDHKEYIDTLRPDREKGPLTEDEKIQDEVQRQVAQCTCVHRFKVYQVGEGKYRFGESQKLRLVRILRSTVMVRVGGGWVALDEFLVKNDPCRAKGRTNLELREQFILAEGVSQSLQPFKPKASPGSSQSSQSGGSSFNRSGMSLSSTGPITKIREKSERSVPMRQQRSHDSSSDGTSFSEADSSFGSRSARSRGTGTPNRLTPAGSNRPGSRPNSRPSSRPPSRATSDLTADHLDGYRSRKLGSSGARQRTPSASSQTSGRNATASSPGTKIPTIRRTPSFGSTGRPEVTLKKERERWK